MPTSIQKLGTAPSVDAVDAWLVELGWSRAVMGQSVQGRELVVYEHTLITTAALEEAALDHQDDENTTTTTLLFLSLIHGNEPLGLVSLLSTAQLLLSGRARLSRLRQQQQQSPTRIVLFPFVNVDAYTLNRHGHGPVRGCLRTNLAELNCTTTSTIKHHPLEACLAVADGVDLERNFPVTSLPLGDQADYDQQQEPCHNSNYRGPYPWSEPETRAVRAVVQHFTVTHVMTFHTRAYQYRPHLLIHPYTSSRSFDEMESTRAQTYRDWSRDMVSGSNYWAGTALETIGYTALGSSIDWMESQGIYAFAVEAVPPCSEKHQRWCTNAVRVFQEARLNAAIAIRFVQLASYGKIAQDDSLAILVIYLGVLGAAYMAWRQYRRRYKDNDLASPCSMIWRRRGKEKQEPETELQSLVRS